MVSRILFLILLSIAPVIRAQEVSKLPLIESCVPMTQCGPGLANLDDAEKQLIRKLLSVVTPGANEQQITQRFGREPFNKNPPMAALGQPAGTTTYKALWSTAEPSTGSAGPHFDVLFINDRAVMFTWYAAWVRKIVRVQIAE